MIPDYQSIMLPLLRIAADKKEHKSRDILEELAAEFKLTDDERKELLPSGRQPIFNNRVGWALTYLKKAGLLDSPRRATIIITQRGLNVLNQKPSKINVRFLRQYPEFVDFQTIRKDVSEVQQSMEITGNQTPEENLEIAYQKIRKSLAQDILNKVVEVPSNFFERLVVELLVKMGYGGSIKDAGTAIGKTGDEGIDGTIKEDKLGLDIIYIQAKRWQPNIVVGRPEIHKFVGALAGKGAKKGIFITTSSFTKEAMEYVERLLDTKVILINGEHLADLMIDYDVGVTKSGSYDIKKIDSDYFSED